MLEHGREGDPFALLGPHPFGSGTLVRAFLPGAHTVDVVDDDDTGHRRTAWRSARTVLFEVYVGALPPHYRLRVDHPTRHANHRGPAAPARCSGELDGGCSR